MVYEISAKDVLFYSLLELSQLSSFNKLSKLLIESHFHELIETNNQTNGKPICHLFSELNGKLIEKVLPQLSHKFVNYNKLLQVLVLSRKLQNDLRIGLHFVSNYNHSDHNYKYDKCIHWSFRQLNLLLASMAMISKSDPTFLDLKTDESFHPKFVDIFYKLKSLKVLSFLAIEPRLPIDLLSLMINETFLWTEPTERDLSVMQMHSRLITQFSNYVKDYKAFQTHMREDFFFDLSECLHFLSTHFHSFTTYLVNCLNETQIHLICDNFDDKLMARMTDVFPEDPHLNTLIQLFQSITQNHSLLTNEDFLVEFINKWFIKTHNRSSLMSKPQ